MALGRRTFLYGLPVLVGAAACVGGAGEARSAHRYLELESTRRAGQRANVLVLMPDTAPTRQVWTGLKDELGSEFGLVAVKIDGPSADASIARAAERHAPACIVLMNNPTVLAYREYQRRSGQRSFPPAVVVMTSFLDARPLVANATGISYEVPLITVVTNLRKLIDSSIEAVGVVRRGPLQAYVARQAALGAREQVRVVEEVVGANANPSELKRALRRLKTRCDAVWILNDDRLLSEHFIAKGWLPGLNERPWVPSIVGVASLVSPAHSLGTFALLPDHTALGAQVANLVFDIAAERWQLPENGRVELPLSTTSMVDLAQVRERFALKSGALQQIDQVLE